MPPPSPQPTTSARVHLREVACHLGTAGGMRVRFRLPDFEAGAGEQVAVVGPSGCGKSTLLNLIAGLLLPDRGEIDVLGQDPRRLSSRRRDSFRGRHIGFIHQTFHLLPDFTALENVQIGLRFGRRRVSGTSRRTAAAAWLERVGLADRRHAWPGRMSVGERQRVAIARALAGEPEILLADEPTGALDRATGRAVMTLIRDLARERHCTLICVTHDPAVAEGLDRTVEARGWVTAVPGAAAA